MIVSESDGAKSRKGADGSYFGEFEYKEVKNKITVRSHRRIKGVG